VKKMSLYVGGFAAMLAGVVVGSTYLFANGPGAVQPVQQQGTKVAVVNIGKVFNEYVRAVAFKKDLEATLAPFKDKAKKITDDIQKWETALKTPGMVPEKDKEQYIAAIKNARRTLEDMGAQIQSDLGKRQEQNLVTLWKEVDMGIAAVARNQGYHIVLGYGDPAQKELLDLFPNVNRKMQAMDLGSSVPLYIDPANDISHIVVFNLNKWAEPKGIQPTGGTK
jgi:Skp family chaperone for outer membrane proteins